MMDKAAFDQTVQIAVEGEIIKAAPGASAWRNDLAKKALAALGGDTNGAAGRRRR